LEDAVQWCDAGVVGLSEQLLGEVTAGVALIERFPMAWHPVSKHICSHRLNRFPYSVVYTTAIPDQIVVIAFAHQQRKPSYWRNRLKKV
jgi:hypothetical protein